MSYYSIGLFLKLQVSIFILSSRLNCLNLTIPLCCSFNDRHIPRTQARVLPFTTYPIFHQTYKLHQIRVMKLLDEHCIKVGGDTHKITQMCTSQEFSFSFPEII